MSSMDANARNIIAEKLIRLRDGKAARVVDLFAGCGGISLGCQLGGAEIVAGVELDPLAARTHALNFHGDRSPDELHVHARARDISLTSPVDLIHDVAPALDHGLAADILVGGPPCQAFARVGRAKLREIMQHPEAFLNDPRAQLYQDYLRYIEALLPVAIIIENVPDILNFGGVNICELIAVTLEQHGYECRYGLLNSVHYGVPQMRERCFLIAITRLAEVEPALPAPTHAWDLPRGYQGTRDVALQSVRSNLIERNHYMDPPCPVRSPRPALTAKDALADLPKITEHLTGELTRGTRYFKTPQALVEERPLHYYRKLMRNWNGFESDGFVYDHVIRYLPRDYAIFARMKPGDQYPEAHQVGVQMRDEAVCTLERERGSPIISTSRVYAELTARFVPPYDPGKFPNKWRKMEADAPARTLMAHLGKDGYSHIHYDSKQARTISVREAARLQSFPDGFRYCGTMNPAFKQIGNAVPPLLAHAVYCGVIDRLLGRKKLRHQHLFDRFVLSMELSSGPHRGKKANKV